MYTLINLSVSYLPNIVVVSSFKVKLDLFQVKNGTGVVEFFKSVSNILYMDWVVSVDRINTTLSRILVRAIILQLASVNSPDSVALMPFNPSKLPFLLSVPSEGRLPILEPILTLYAVL